MQEIVLDTETTGLDPLRGDRIVEIGCISLSNHIPDGRRFHCYINPERTVPIEAFRIHQLSTEFLSQYPIFADHAHKFLQFIGEESILIIHNAEFDIKFLNVELKRLNLASIPMNRTIDTMKLARKRFPGTQVNLDALCRRFKIDFSHRAKHGALIDAELLANVYLELIGGHQPNLQLISNDIFDKSKISPIDIHLNTRKINNHTATYEEIEAHNEMIKKIKNVIWLE